MHLLTLLLLVFGQKTSIVAFFSEGVIWIYLGDWLGWIVSNWQAGDRHISFYHRLWVCPICCLESWEDGREL